MATQKKSATGGQTYTYRGGEKIALNKAEDEFVVRTVPEELQGKGLEKLKQVSSASTKVTTDKEKLEEKMAEAREMAPTHHAYYDQDSGEEFLITDRIMVTFKKPISDKNLDAFSVKYGLILLEKYTEQEYLFQVTKYTGINPVKLVVKLTEDEKDLIEFAENDLNQRMKKRQLVLPNDEVYSRQWHLHNRFINPLYDTRSCANCEDAWKALDNFGSHDVVIGVTDDGCRLNHPDFNSPGKFASWGYMRNSRLITHTDIDADPAEMYIPGANHGTSCAGVIAGEADGVLTVGAAPGCRLLPIQWESDDSSLFISDSKFLTVLNYIEDKVDVLSNSWGNVPRSLWTAAVINKIKQLAQTGGRRGKGIVFLWAAGNENCPIQFQSNTLVPYTDGYEFENNQWVWSGVKTARIFSNNLVGIPGVMHVAALSSMAQKSHYSNYGTGVEIAAPSSNSHAYFRLSVKGLGVSTTTGTSTNITHTFGGTSSATPLAAGIAALVISVNPELTAMEVISILKQTASKTLDMHGYDRTPPASYDPDTSWDISPVTPFDKPDFKNNGSADGTWSPWFGHGRIDAAAAVKKALDLLRADTTIRVKMVSAMVNPSGVDTGNEKISLMNLATTSSSIAGWTLTVNGRKQLLNGQIRGGETLTVTIDPSKLRLPNTGATISLLNAQGDMVQEAVYTKKDVKAGQVVVF